MMTFLFYIYLGKSITCARSICNKGNVETDTCGIWRAKNLIPLDSLKTTQTPTFL